MIFLSQFALRFLLGIIYNAEGSTASGMIEMVSREGNLDGWMSI